jgi:hypothetical protein
MCGNEKEGVFAMVEIIEEIVLKMSYCIPFYADVYKVRETSGLIRWKLTLF